MGQETQEGRNTHPGYTESVVLCDHELFKEELIEYGGRHIFILSMEHEPRHSDPPKPHLPSNWEQLIIDRVNGKSLVFLEWFMPEVEQRLYNVPILGSANRFYVENHIAPVYNRILDILAVMNIEVAVADIVHSPMYSVYELHALGTLTWFGYGQEDFDVKAREMTEKEFIIPTPMDARRLLTARAIIQEVLRRKEGTEAVLITPFAHADRVSKYIKLGGDPDNQLKNIVYRYGLPFVEKTLRLYKYSSRFQCWIKYASCPIF